MIIELMIQHYLTSPNIKNIIKLRKIAYLGAKFFLAPCFFMLVCAISWEQRKLGEIATFINGRAYSQDELLSSGKYKVLRVGNFYTNDSWYYSDMELDDKYYAENGDLLYTWSATFGPHIWRGDKVIYHYHIWKIELSQHLEKRFAVQLLEQDKAAILSDKNGSTMVHITKAGMEEKAVLIPQNIDEQVKIGTFLNNLDNLITLHQREYFLFDFSGESAKTAQNTLSWEQRKLGECVSITSGEAPSKFKPGSINYVKVDDLNYAYKTVVDTQNKVSDNLSTSKVEVGSVIFPKRGAAILTNKVRILGVESYMDTNMMALTATSLDSDFLYILISREGLYKIADTSTIPQINNKHIEPYEVIIPSLDEQKCIGEIFAHLDKIITLHQREPPKEDKILNDIKTDTLFHEYYCQWLVIYKEGSVRGVTMQKYHLTAEWVKKLIPDVKLCDFDRITYQQLINDYAETHERQTTMDFHHQLKGAILDAVDDGLIARDPTRKVIIKGKSPNDKKKKYLSRYELQKLLTNLDLNSGFNTNYRKVSSICIIHKMKRFCK